jgi:membrane protease YdiL (CAAX protease family)
LQKYKILEAYPYNRSDNHPSISLFYLLLTVLISAVIFSFIGLGLGILFYGKETISIAGANFKQLTDNQLNFISIVQIFSAIGTFIIPALVLNRIEKNRQPYFDLKMPSKTGLFLFVLGIMIGYSEFFEWTIFLNEQMKFPSFLKEVEHWMRNKEDETTALTNALLSRTSISALVTNLFMVGIVAAIGEELLFRGCLQNILKKWFGNPHLAIWLSAAVFSAIHLQFYGFFPRMLIGALCGYLYFWGKSIWLPILAHLANNTFAIAMAFYLSRSGRPLNYFEYDAKEWPFALLGLIAGSGLLFAYKMYAKKLNQL